MIMLNNIIQKNDVIELEVQTESFLDSPWYRMAYYFKTGKYRCSIKNPEPLDINKIIYRLSSYLKRNVKLPSKDVIIWY